MHKSRTNLLLYLTIMIIKKMYTLCILCHQGLPNYAMCCVWSPSQTTTNQAIFRVEAAICRLFREYLTKQGFVEIHTPKIISGNNKMMSNVADHVSITFVIFVVKMNFLFFIVYVLTCQGACYCEYIVTEVGLLLL